MLVYVLNRKGRPLMPTNRCDHVRKLLKAGLAVPVCNEPFTIRLKYDAKEYVQNVYLGEDSGRTNIGAAASNESGACLLLSELDTHNKSIKKQMADRRMHRMSRRRHRRKKNQRRAIRNNTAIQNGQNDILGAVHEDGRKNKPCKSLEIKYPREDKPTVHKVCRGREARFANRRRLEGWLTPSGRQLLEMHIRLIEETMKFLPVSHIILERASFDFQKLENENIKAWEYGKGILYGYKDYKEYIKELQNGKCLLCGSPIERYHHVRQRKDGGTDHVSNIAGLCYKCHDKVHKDDDTAKGLLELREEAARRHSIGLLNSIMPKLIEEMRSFCEEHCIIFSITDGHTTKETREKFGIQKGHALDAYAISLSNRDIDNASFKTKTVYHRSRFKKKSKGCISKLGRREYLHKGKVVAVNRHKGMDQKEDSLEEYMNHYAESHTGQECRRHFHELETRPAKRVYTYHKKNQVKGQLNQDKVKVPVKAGDLVKYEKHNKIKGNTKMDIFVATKLDMSNEVIRFGTKNRQIKNCRSIQTSVMPIINKSVYDE